MEMELDLEIGKAVDKIEDEQPELVCVQLPDGLKSRADEIKRKIESETDTNVVLWGSSCFGACDVPVGLDDLGIDLTIQFGHSRWNPKLDYDYS